MASDVSVGDIEAPYIDVTGDGTTAATLTVHKPDGDDLTPVVTPGTPTDGIIRLTAAPVTYDAAGRWVLQWTIAGAGAGNEDTVVQVIPTPTAGGPTWLPGRSRVAAYVPQRTLARLPDSITEVTDEYKMTFDSTTRPTGVQTDDLIADGAAWVASQVTPLAPALNDAASVCAALYAAAMIERSWPHDDNSLQRANDLEKRLDKQLAALIKANTDANGGDDPTNPSDHLLPIWSFPDPVPHGDWLL